MYILPESNFDDYSMLDQMKYSFHYGKHSKKQVSKLISNSDIAFMDNELDEFAIDAFWDSIDWNLLAMN